MNTTIEVWYPDPGADIGLRGSLEPLRWDASAPPTRKSGVERSFVVYVPPGEVLEFKVTRGETWSQERNYSVVGGETCRVRPYFDRDHGELQPKRSAAAKALGRSLDYEVFLPPSYGEHTDRRYPVLYAQDGHIVFSTGSDPFGPAWAIDATLDELYEIGAMDEIIVVGVQTREGRVELLTPSRDPRHGGGDAAKYLDFLIETLKPAIDADYRTLAGPNDTGMLGSSMGGLFAFFAAWRRSDVFGKAACLSSSFWWDDRFMVKDVRAGGCPVPRPLLYIDSGAAKSDFEEDASRRDGYDHTIAMRNALLGHCYEPGVHVHVLAFPGSAHENTAWAARLATPLQLLFPRGA